MPLLWKRRESPASRSSCIKCVRIPRDYTHSVFEINNRTGFTRFLNATLKVTKPPGPARPGSSCLSHADRGLGKGHAEALVLCSQTREAKLPPTLPSLRKPTIPVYPLCGEDVPTWARTTSRAEAGCCGSPHPRGRGSPMASVSFHSHGGPTEARDTRTRFLCFRFHSHSYSCSCSHSQSWPCSPTQVICGTRDAG